MGKSFDDKESNNDTKAWSRMFYSETWNGVLVKPLLEEMIEEKRKSMKSKRK